MKYLLRREDGGKFLVDSDLWVGALDLAVRHGWKPRGVQESDAASSAACSTPLRYADGWGQRIVEDDATDLARGLDAALPSIPDKAVPMQDKAFGEDTLRDLIERASAGENISPEELPGAAEVLSGPPKGDARLLAEFLAQGSLTVHGT